MNILGAYDLTGSLRDAAELAGCSHHTVARYVAEREQGRAVPAVARRPQPAVGGFLPKLEELVERSKGKIRADVAHEKITAMGYAGSERTTRRSPRTNQPGMSGGHHRADLMATSGHIPRPPLGIYGCPLTRCDSPIA